MHWKMTERTVGLENEILYFPTLLHVCWQSAVFLQSILQSWIFSAADLCRQWTDRLRCHV